MDSQHLIPKSMGADTRKDFHTEVSSYSQVQPKSTSCTSIHISALQQMINEQSQPENFAIASQYLKQIDRNTPSSMSGPFSRQTISTCSSMDSMTNQSPISSKFSARSQSHSVSKLATNFDSSPKPSNVKYMRCHQITNNDISHDYLKKIDSVTTTQYMQSQPTFISTSMDSPVCATYMNKNILTTENSMFHSKRNNTSRGPLPSVFLSQHSPRKASMPVPHPYQHTNLPWSPIRFASRISTTEKHYINSNQFTSTPITKEYASKNGKQDKSFRLNSAIPAQAYVESCHSNKDSSTLENQNRHSSHEEPNSVEKLKFAGNEGRTKGSRQWSTTCASATEKSIDAAPPPNSRENILATKNCESQPVDLLRHINECYSTMKTYLPKSQVSPQGICPNMDIDQHETINDKSVYHNSMKSDENNNQVANECSHVSRSVGDGHSKVHRNCSFTLDQDGNYCDKTKIVPLSNNREDKVEVNQISSLPTSSSPVYTISKNSFLKPKHEREVHGLLDLAALGNLEPLDLSHKESATRNNPSQNFFNSPKRFPKAVMNKTVSFDPELSDAGDSPGRLCIDLDVTNNTTIHDEDTKDSDRKAERIAGNTLMNESRSYTISISSSQKDDVQNNVKSLSIQLPLKKRRVSECSDGSSSSVIQPDISALCSPGSNTDWTVLSPWAQIKTRYKCKKCSSDYRATSLVRCPVCPQKATIQNCKSTSVCNSSMRSLSTLPLEISLCRKNNVMTVTANTAIINHTLLGPLEGDMVPMAGIPVHMDVGYLWPMCNENETRNEMLLSTHDERTSNWLRYVRVGKDLSTYNVALIHKRDQIFFITMRELTVGQELILRPLDPFILHTNLMQEMSCTLCKILFPSPLHLAKHRAIFHPSSSPNNAPPTGIGYLGKYTSTQQCNSPGDPQHISDPDQELGEGVKKKINSAANDSRSELSKWCCTDCNSYFKSKAGYSAHVAIVHKRSSKDTESPYSCHQCNRSFRTTWSLQCHQRSHALDASACAVLTCPQCGRDFFRKQSYRRHLQAHQATASQMTPSCDHCGRRFYSSSNLKVHMLTHSGIKPFSCQVLMCSASFTTKQSLQFHYIKRHGYFYQNMPNIERNVPFTFEHYCGTSPPHSHVHGEKINNNQLMVEEAPLDYRCEAVNQEKNTEFRIFQEHYVELCNRDSRATSRKLEDGGRDKSDEQKSLSYTNNGGNQSTLNHDEESGYSGSISSESSNYSQS